MTQTWQHIANLDWLKARPDYLTASTMASLWPETATGKKRTVTDDDYLALIFANKEVDTSAVYSSGPAARGHILERFAVNEYNLQRAEEEVRVAKTIYHWDDCLIHNDGIIAFSPDALTIPQPDKQIVHSIAELEKIKEVDEIKSYKADKHHATYKMGQKAKERIQVATQMYVCEEAETGRLILYNPRLDHGALFYIVWLRSDLELELEIIEHIGARYCSIVEKIADNLLPKRIGPSEEEILQILRNPMVIA